MLYDAFISYSRSDESWALKLQQEIEARGFLVYRDKERLRGGDKWDEGLHEALTNSRHLLLLWSQENAEASDWVRAEAAAFRMLIHQDDRAGAPVGRTLIQVCLQGRNHLYERYQTIEDLSVASQYSIGCDRVDPNLWSTVVEKIAASLDRRDDLPIVHQVVLASTRQRMANIMDDERPIKYVHSFAELLNYLNIPSREMLLAHYGDERCEWRPFGSQKSIRTVLNLLRAEMLARGASPFRWKPIGAKFWDGTLKQVEDIVDRLCEEPSVIIMDALSLLDEEVSKQYDRILECLGNSTAALMVLPPFSLSPRNYLREFLGFAAERFCKYYFRPKLSERQRVRAKCRIIADDEAEMAQVLGEILVPQSGRRHKALTM